MPEWVQVLLGGGGFLGLAAVLTVYATRKRDRSADSQDRFEATSELAKYMREEIAKEVEIQMKPMREELVKVKTELTTVKTESHEMNDVVRSREVRIWMWDQRGRVGPLPMLPAAILAKLGLENLVPPLEMKGS